MSSLTHYFRPEQKGIGASDHALLDDINAFLEVIDKYYKMWITHPPTKTLDTITKVRSCYHLFVKFLESSDASNRYLILKKLSQKVSLADCCKCIRAFKNATEAERQVCIADRNRIRNYVLSIYRAIVDDIDLAKAMENLKLDTEAVIKSIDSQIQELAKLELSQDLDGDLESIANQNSLVG